MEKNRLNRRQFFKLSAGTASVAILAACSPKAPGVVEKEVTRIVGGTPQVVKETVIATPPPQPVELSLLMVDWNEDSRKVLDEVTIPKFQGENPGITVTVDYTDWGQLDAKVMTAAAGGLQPDLIQADLIEFGSKYYLKGLIAEMNPLVEATPGAREKIADYYEKGIYEGCSWEGKLLALPYIMDNRALFYRKDFFDEVGLDGDKPPSNWEEFQAAAKALTIREGDSWKRMGWFNPAGQFCFQTYVQFLWQNGGQLVNETADGPAFNTPEGVEALEFWTRLIREDQVAPVEGMEAQGDLSLMTAGALATEFTGYWQLLNVKKYAPELWDSQGVAVLGNTKKAGLWYVNCYILSSGPRLEPAWGLLQALVLDDDNFGQYLTAQGGLPPRKSLTESLEHITPLHRILIEDVMNAENSHTSPLVRFAVMELYERIDEACQNAVYGKMTPKEALAKAEDECKQIFARHLSEG